MKKKISRSQQIPKYDNPIRSTIISYLTALPDYQEGIRKGFPLFTTKELDEIKDNYKDGLTWKDIDKILSAKGIFFKKATFRKYIQVRNISKAIGYKNTENGRVAIFPVDTISHINFIQYYYKVIDGEHLDNILETIRDKQISYLEVIENNLVWKDNIYASIFDDICHGDGDTADAIKKALGCRPSDRDKFLKILNDINDKFDKTIRNDIDKFVSQLQKKYLTVFEITDDNQGGQDE